MTAERPPSALRGPLLRAVSRSFYLSIRLLPPKLRDPIALAYLLARATDTIADTHDMDAGLRRQHLAALAALIQSDSDASAAAALVASFAPHQKNSAERTLIEQLPATLQWLASTRADDRADIRAVLEHINEGQAIDVARFSDADGVIALETAAELDRYTYLVAGSVGEFWTTLCFRHIPQFATSPPEKMRELGIEYGKGLQLINVLRDLGPDLRGGRCYLPRDELESLGIKPKDLSRSAAALEPVLERWRQRAHEGLGAGIEYACAIKPWRVRLATVLPALVGARTLTLLREAGAEVFQRKVKITRWELRRMMWRTIATLAAPASLYEQFRLMSDDGRPAPSRAEHSSD